MKSLNGAELAGYIKENQAHLARSLRGRKVVPKLVIIRDSKSPVIEKYVHLKQQYGEDIGVAVEDVLTDDIAEVIRKANEDDSVHGIIVQLPLEGRRDATEYVNMIAPEKDVDGLGEKASFDSATATAINWLLAGYNIDLEREKIALVGYGKLVGRPLATMWQNSGYDVTVFRHADDLNELKNYSVVVSATGVAHLIKPEMIKSGAIVVDAGTASEGGVLVGDVSDELRKREDLEAITPRIGGVGPLTVTALFEHTIIAANEANK